MNSQSDTRFGSGLLGMGLLVMVVATSGCSLLTAVHTPTEPDKVCIAHRGASAYAPEHTLAGYRMAMEMDADYVEQDLQMTKDGVLICMHDTALERTTNVEEVFPDRFRKSDHAQGGKTWPVPDFTLEEIQQLDAGSWFDPEFAGARVPTFQEALDLIKGKSGIYPELKEPSFYAGYGMNMVDAVIKQLAANGLDTPKGQARTPVLIQSFSPEALKEMRAKTGSTYRLIQLVDTLQARELMSDDGMKSVAGYAYGLGPSILILRADPTRVLKAHELGLKLHPYTVNEANKPSEFADLRSYTSYLLYDLGVDGLFTNNPDIFPREASEKAG